MAQRDDSPQTLVGISFDDNFRAQEFLSAATRHGSKGNLRIEDAVVVAKALDGNTRVVETIDPSPGRSALSGGMWAGLFGLLLGGPVGWIAGGVIGASAGAVTAKVVDLGIPDEWVEWFRQTVQPGTTTVVLLLRDVDLPALTDEAERFRGAKLVYANVDPLSFSDLMTALGDTTARQAEPPVEGPLDTEAPTA